MELSMFDRGRLDFVRQCFIGPTNELLDRLEDRASTPREGQPGHEDFVAGFEAAQKDYMARVA